MRCSPCLGRTGQRIFRAGDASTRHAALVAPHARVRSGLPAVLPQTCPRSSSRQRDCKPVAGHRNRQSSPIGSPPPVLAWANELAPDALAASGAAQDPGRDGAVEAPCKDKSKWPNPATVDWGGPVSRRNSAVWGALAALVLAATVGGWPTAGAAPAAPPRQDVAAHQRAPEDASTIGRPTKPVPERAAAGNATGSADHGDELQHPDG